MDILIFGPEKLSDYVTWVLKANPLPKEYVYTAVSFLEPGQVRVQAMEAMLANAMLDTGERISETGDSLESAVNKMITRLKGEPYEVSPADVWDFGPSPDSMKVGQLYLPARILFLIVGTVFSVFVLLVILYSLFSLF